MFQQNKTLYESKLKEQFENNLDQTVFNIVMIIFQLILFVLQIFGIPFQDKSFIEQSLYQEITQQIIGITSVLCIILHIFAQLIQQVDLKTAEIHESSIINNSVHASMLIVSRTFDQDQSLDMILSSGNTQNLVKAAQMEPGLFWNDQSDLIKIHILFILSPAVNTEEIQSLKSKISERVYNTVESLVESYQGDFQFIEFMRNSADKIKNVLSLFNIQDKSDKNRVQEYNQLQSLTNEFFEKCQIVIEKAHKNYKPVDGLKEVSDYSISSNNYYSSSFSSKVVEQIDNNEQYDKEVDQVLMKWYQTQLTDNDIKDNSKNNKLPKINTNHILKMIEKKLGISRKTKKISYEKKQKTTISKSEFIPNEIIYYTIIHEDKSVDELNNDQKNVEDNMHTDVPFFQNMVQDRKQARLIFNSEQDILQFLSVLKSSFGDGYKEELAVSSDAKVRITNLLNNFNASQDSMSIISFQPKYYNKNEAKKITIVFEIQFIPQNYSVKMEVQLISTEEVCLQETSQVMEEWRESQQRHSNLLSLQDKIKEQESVYALKFSIWQAVQGLILLVLVPTLIFTVLELNGFIDLNMEECFTTSNPYNKLLNFCNSKISDFSTSQKLSFCNTQQKQDQVQNTCSNDQFIQQDICMKQELDEFVKLPACKNSWATNQLNFSPQEQHAQCQKFQYDTQVNTTCMMIEGVQYDICMKESLTLSDMCKSYWTNQQSRLTNVDQIQFCGKFDNVPEVNLVCIELKPVFQSVCIIKKESDLTDQCVNFFVDSQDTQTELEKQVLCNKFESTEAVKQLCENSLDIKQHRCQRSMTISNDCILWFELNWMDLTDSQQQTYCQMYSNNISMSSICIFVPSMVNQLYEICMALDFNPAYISCANQLSNNYNSHSDSEIIELCQQYNLMPEMNNVCWKVIEKPVTMISNVYNDNVCMQTEVKVNCLYNFENLEQFNENLPMSDIEFVGASQIIRSKSNNFIKTDIDPTEYGYYFQDNQIINNNRFGDIQMTDASIISTDFNTSIFQSSNTGYQFQQQHDLNNRILFAGYYVACIIGKNHVLCDGTSNNQGERDIPSTYENESAVTGDFGFFHACLVTLNYSLDCWGRNSEGQQNQPLAYAADNSTSFVFTAAYTTCAVNYSKTNADCFGQNNQGEANQPSELDGKELAGGSGKYQMLCALVKNGGALTCWGRNAQGAVEPPAALATGVRRVELGQWHACVIMESTGQVGCWGESSFVPQEFDEVEVLKMSCGSERSCLQRKSDNYIQCQWQQNTSEPFYIIDKYPPRDFQSGISSVVWSVSFTGDLKYTTNGDTFVRFEASSIIGQDFVNGTKQDISVEMQKTNVFSIGPNMFCENIVEFGEFMCSGVPVPDDPSCVESPNSPCSSSVLQGLISPVMLNVFNDLLCVIEDHICYVSSMDSSTAECVSPLDTESVVLSISYPDMDVDPMMKEITNIICGKNRFCVRQADQTAQCAGTEIQGGQMENTIPSEINMGIMQVKAGTGFTCLLYKNFTIKCNGIYINSINSTPLIFTIHDEPISSV